MLWISNCLVFSCCCFQCLLSFLALCGVFVATLPLRCFPFYEGVGDHGPCDPPAAQRLVSLGGDELSAGECARGSLVQGPVSGVRPGWVRDFLVFFFSGSAWLDGLLFSFF